MSLALDSKMAHTSFGKLPLSTEKTSECYGFPKGLREDQAKIYAGELTAAENLGKNSAPVFYQYEDTIKYEQPPKFSFGEATRCGAVKPKYDFYENALFLDDPITADNNKRPRCCAPKIGTEPRVSFLCFPNCQDVNKRDRKQSRTAVLP